MAVLGKILTTVGSIVPSAVSSIFNAGAVRRQNEANMALAKYQYDLNRKAIQEQNEYNSPVAQMARYQEAGLNPNMIYGNGSSSAGNQQGIASYNAPTMQANRYDFSQMLNSLTQALQIEGLKLDNRNKFYQSGIAQQKAEQEALNTNTMRWQQGLLGENLALAPDSPYVKKYNAELAGISTLNDVRRSQQLLNSLTANQKRFYNTFIQPLLMEGMSLDNELLRKNVNAFWYKFGVDAGSKVVGALSPFALLSLRKAISRPTFGSAGSLGSY